VRQKVWNENDATSASSDRSNRRNPRCRQSRGRGPVWSVV